MSKTLQTLAEQFGRTAMAYMNNGHSYIANPGEYMAYCLTCEKYTTPDNTNNSVNFCDNPNTYSGWTQSYYVAWLHAKTLEKVFMTLSGYTLKLK